MRQPIFAPHIRALPAAQRGMAVVGALLVVMVATMLVTGLIQRQAADVRAMENALARSQGRVLLASGLDWARLVLYSDGRRFSTTLPNQLWAVPVEDTRVTQDGGERVAVFSGRIYDEQGKFNLRNLAEHGVIQGEAYEALRRLLNQFALPGELASQIARRIAMSQIEMSPEGTMVRGPLAPMPTTLDDLASLGALSPEAIDVLRPYVTILPDVTAVNANTASAEVLSAIVAGLALGQARALVAQRDRGVWFYQTTDFAGRLGNPDIRPDETLVAVNSDWFLVKGAVTLERSVITIQALLNRNGREIPEIVWTMELH